MDICDKVDFVYNLYDFDGRGQLRPDSLCSIFRTAVNGLIKINPTQYLLSNASSSEFDLIANTFYDFYYSSTYGYGFATREDFNIYCVSHPVVGSWLKYFSTIKSESKLGISKGDHDIISKDIPQNVPMNVPCFNYSPEYALNASIKSVQTTESDFDNFYTPSVRALNVHVEKYIPPLHFEGAVEVEVAVDVQAKSEEKKDEITGETDRKKKNSKRDGGEEGGDEEVKENDNDETEAEEDDEEEEEEVEVVNEHGEEEEEVEVEIVPIVKPKILKTPYPFDSEESKSKYVIVSMTLYFL